mgnify:CR=1 FL=1
MIPLPKRIVKTLFEGLATPLECAERLYESLMYLQRETKSWTKIREIKREKKVREGFLSQSTMLGAHYRGLQEPPKHSLPEIPFFTHCGWTRDYVHAQ